MADGGDLAKRLADKKGQKAPAGRQPKPGITRSSVYFDDEDWQRLRRAAFDAAVPINSLIVASVRRYFDASDAEKDAVVDGARQVARERRAP